MHENTIATAIVNASFMAHTELGPGLYECVYEVIVADTLRSEGFDVVRQKPIPIRFKGRQFDEGFRADIVVNNLVLVEMKSLEVLARVHRKQTLTYLKLSGLRLGLLINFGGELLKNNIERIVNNLGDSELPPP